MFQKQLVFIPLQNVCYRGLASISGLLEQKTIVQTCCKLSKPTEIKTSKTCTYFHLTTRKSEKLKSCVSNKSAHIPHFNFLESSLVVPKRVKTGEYLWLRMTEIRRYVFAARNKMLAIHS